ncbi:hypothetical protein DRQ53_15085 [bacterium]|nr:MAG: hypothetical protein DRQ53_15085 [bacterium]
MVRHIRLNPKDKPLTASLCTNLRLTKVAALNEQKKVYAKQYLIFRSKEMVGAIEAGLVKGEMLEPASDQVLKALARIKARQSDGDAAKIFEKLKAENTLELPAGQDGILHNGRMYLNKDFPRLAKVQTRRAELHEKLLLNASHVIIWFSDQGCLSQSDCQLEIEKMIKWTMQQATREH